MNQDSNTKAFSLLLFVLILFTLVKIAWVGIEYFILPKEGISINKSKIGETLYYRYNLASEDQLEEIKPIAQKKHKKSIAMRNMVLTAIYSQEERSVIVVKKGPKSYVLATGDNIDGFVLQYATAKSAYFKKSKKTYSLKMTNKKSKQSSSVDNLVQAPKSSKTKENVGKNTISTTGDTREIPKSMIEKYSSDFRSIIRDIGLRPYRQDGQISGYKVRFIRHGSPMSKLGLKKGDIIKAINGEEIIDPSVPMSFIKKASKLESLTITIQRQNQDKDLEYEVK